MPGSVLNKVIRFTNPYCENGTYELKIFSKLQNKYNSFF
jgi:hypothetical protein